MSLLHSRRGGCGLQSVFRHHLPLYDLTPAFPQLACSTALEIHLWSASDSAQGHCSQKCMSMP